ncbi:PTS sugar transporter subunit IIC [Clostridium sp. CF011]|uniref:PTS transporter subunit IIC n=1 Tax=unclassified Clostridium TaxID=2614128 RepID=UPI001C0D639C|nr:MULTISPECIES: PTS sugar transporter subunit IIC [unclassified Clostridium]MBU3092636.1 PTS sugar transporter subunit IIC [Clostridium sp. CF011]MBW9145322.1 PTS sugar transporter subunit IIC [Clostridium sp. CM027]UVE42461.1 PTS sugar transporter subunit IIC [Clostridium sp. CM027]WAG71480.1 PTS sugar transporter subunit IIC [Clostridium sp. CF011]
MEKFKIVVKKGLKRYFLDALSAMALGLFASLIIGLILSQLSKIPALAFLEEFAEIISVKSPVVGAAIGVAIAWGLKVTPLTMFSCAATGAFGYMYMGGGPVGSFIAAVIGAELGNFVSGKTKIDIVIVPIVTIVTGSISGKFVGPYISVLMTNIGAVINSATTLMPIPMGIAVSTLMGLALTAPISSAAIAISLKMSGLAAGAATVGCSAQMIGFAVSSYRENKISGLVSQGLGTSMLQVPNIIRRPQVWIPPTLAGAILGPLATTVLSMKNNSLGAGMGTSGLVGQFGTLAAMQGSQPTSVIVLKILLLHFIAPAVLTLLFSEIMRKKGWISQGDLKLKL